MELHHEKPNGFWKINQGKERDETMVSWYRGVPLCRMVFLKSMSVLFFVFVTACFSPSLNGLSINAHKLLGVVEFSVNQPTGVAISSDEQIFR